MHVYHVKRLDYGCSCDRELERVVLGQIELKVCWSVLLEDCSVNCMYVLCCHKEMPLTKSCPECHMHCCKCEEVCVIVLLLRRKTSCDTARKSKSIAMKCKRGLETVAETACQQTGACY